MITSYIQRNINTYYIKYKLKRTTYTENHNNKNKQNNAEISVYDCSNKYM